MTAENTSDTELRQHPLDWLRENYPLIMGPVDEVSGFLQGLPCNCIPEDPCQRCHATVALDAMQSELWRMLVQEKEERDRLIGLFDCRTGGYKDCDDCLECDYHDTVRCLIDRERIWEDYGELIDHDWSEGKLPAPHDRHRSIKADV